MIGNNNILDVLIRLMIKGKIVTYISSIYFKGIEVGYASFLGKAIDFLAIFEIAQNLFWHDNSSVCERIFQLCLFCHDTRAMNGKLQRSTVFFISLVTKIGGRWGGVLCICQHFLQV